MGGGGGGGGGGGEGHLSLVMCFRDGVKQFLAVATGRG